MYLIVKIIISLCNIIKFSISQITGDKLFGIQGFEGLGEPKFKT